ncbi:putative LSM domain-containing protein [Rosellinia necatrix]|uniref:Putative LSM domain-containing protein n=1 Tax=Rosellinia necatrix TaxID=77044 RepID=A0A1W2TKK2_ROSNE|nr:putative LSM domain-containing protein [Rosellinia necatrix]
MQAVAEQLDRATMNEAPTTIEAKAYLHSLINKTLRIHATDGRMFIGTFKCTDTGRNVVLSVTYEYRHPSQQKLTEAAAAAAAAADANVATVKADMTSRYLGLVVIPGEHIVKMEVEEFTSQVKNRSIWERRDIYSSTS